MDQGVKKESLSNAEGILYRSCVFEQKILVTDFFNPNIAFLFKILIYLT